MQWQPSWDFAKFIILRINVVDKWRKNTVSFLGSEWNITPETGTKATLSHLQLLACSPKQKATGFEPAKQ